MRPPTATATGFDRTAARLRLRFSLARSLQKMDEIRKIPIVTRSVIGGVLAGTLPVLAGILPIYPLVFIPQRVTRDWQLWRLLTSFCFGGKGLAFVFDLFMMYRGLNDLEESHFRRRTADMGECGNVWQAYICSSVSSYSLGSCPHVQRLARRSRRDR